MTKMGMHRTIPQKPLKRTRSLNHMSKRAKEELKLWLEVKLKRMIALETRYGIILCEYCHKPIDFSTELFVPEGHHNNHNRRENTFGNCRILHRICNQLIEDRNVKDIPSML